MTSYHIEQCKLLRADETVCVSDCVRPCARRDGADEQPCIYPPADLSQVCSDYVRPDRECPACQGTGSIEVPCCPPSGSADCPCGGYDLDECPDCNGTGGMP
jgi:hypothetical protein